MAAGETSRLKAAAKKEAHMVRIFGIVLVVLGLIGLAWGGFSYTHKEKVVDIGPIQASKDTKETVPIPPIAGAVAVVAGIALLASGNSR